MNNEAFSLLIDIAEQSQRNAERLPELEQLQTNWSGIGFRIGSFYFVSPMIEISEVIELPSYTTLPGVKPWVLGIANVRGRLLPIMDMHSLFNAQQEEKLQAQKRVIVLDIDNLYSGLLVDEIFGMQHFLVDSFNENLENCSKSFLPFVQGYYERDQNWYVFSPYLLAQDPNFFNSSPISGVGLWDKFNKKYTVYRTNRREPKL